MSSETKRAEFSWGFVIHIAGVLVAGLAVLLLAVLLLLLLIQGIGKIDIDFLTGYPSRFAHRAGVLPALVGSLYLILLTALVSLPVGVGAAIYLEEYAPKNWMTRLIEVNIANLAGVPSIIYGVLGLQLYARWFGCGRSLLAGALTMATLVLPIIILAAREALRRVPPSLREGALALGATRWQMVRDQVLPAAAPGVLTGCILAFSRAIGETAPLIAIGALTYMSFLPESLFDEFTALPIQAFNWISRPQAAFHENAAGVIIVLMVIMLSMNLTAAILRNRFERRFGF